MTTKGAGSLWDFRFEPGDTLLMGTVDAMVVARGLASHPLVGDARGDGLQKVAGGLTTVEEVFYVTST